MLLTNWLLVLLTLLLVFLTFLVWKVYERIAWLTGSMETHSDLMLRIEALRGINDKPIELIWWDPTIAEPPVHPEPWEASRTEPHTHLRAAEGPPPQEERGGAAARLVLPTGRLSRYVAAPSLEAQGIRPDEQTYSE